MKRYMVNNLIRALSIFIFFFAIFLYTITFNNPTGWVLFFFLTMLFVWDAFILILPLKKIQVQLLESSRYEVNRPNKMKLEIFRHRPTLLKIPLLTVVFKKHRSTKKIYLSRYSGQRQELTFEWRPTQRGVFQQLSFVLISSDLFQIFSKQSNSTVTGPFVVLPALQLDLAEQIYKHLLQAKPNFDSSFGNPTFSIRNFRTYQIGDSFNSVDWKQSGKRNELIVKEYEYEAETDLHFLFYGLSHEKFEELLSIYYSFISLVENKLSFQQTILTDLPHSIQKEHIFSAMTPLLEECLLPNFTNKKLVIFTTTKTNQLSEQLTALKRKNEVFLIAFEGEDLCLHWKDQVSSLPKGGLTLEK